MTSQAIDELRTGERQTSTEQPRFEPPYRRHEASRRGPQRTLIGNPTQTQPEGGQVIGSEQLIDALRSNETSLRVSNDSFRNPR